MASKYFDIEKNTILELIRANITDIVVTDSIIEDNSDVVRVTIKDTSVASGVTQFDIIDFDRYEYGREIVPNFDYKNGLTLYRNKKNESANLISFDKATGEIKIASGFSSDVSKGDELSIKQSNAKLYIYYKNPFYNKINGSVSKSIKRFQFELSVDNDKNNDNAQYYTDQLLMLFNSSDKFLLIEEDGSITNKLLYIEDSLQFDDEEVIGETKIIYGSILIGTYVNR